MAGHCVTYAADDRPLLLVDAYLWGALNGATLAEVDTSDGRQLTLVGLGSGGQKADSENGAH